MFKKLAAYKTLIESAIFIVVVSSLVLSLFASLNLRGSQTDFPRHQLSDLADAATNTFAANLDTYVFTLYGLRGYFAGSSQISRSEFQMFVNSLDLPRHSPGIWALLYLDRVASNNVSSYIETMKNDTSLPGLRMDNFTVWPLGEQSEHLVVSYSEPSHLDYIREVLGYDFASNADRIAAFHEAVKLNEAVMTNPVVSAVTQSELFVLLLPIYQKNESVITHEQRREAASGAVAMSFQQKVLFNEAFEKILYNNPDVRIRVYDGPEVASDKLLYDSFKDKQVLGETSTRTLAREVRTIEATNRVWTIESSFTATPANSPVWNWIQLAANVVGLAGIVALVPLHKYIVRHSRQT